MLFNSFEFIFVFLPIVLIGYFTINKFSHTAGKIWLVLASFFFYSWWNPVYLPLLLVSILTNFAIGSAITQKEKTTEKKAILTIGIIFNVGLLGLFKYYDFFVSNLNFLLRTDFNFLNLVLPLAISFYTFQQIAYLVDSYRNETKENGFLNYVLFISFFPQLIAGPIVHHKEMMSQYEDITRTKINHENFSKGIFIFSIGLFKKVAIADTLSIWVNNGYANVEALTFFDSWLTSLAYTLQIYFDFSGYTDMAIGLALLFNIRLPVNFNSPYKAKTIREFWQRWHITLSRFLTKYIYFPLGGNKISPTRTYINIFIIMFISGFWHGAGWTFIMWGSMHGIALVINRAWFKAGFRLNKILAWVITFHFLNVSRVFFRSPDIPTAFQVLGSMVGLNGFHVPEQFAAQFQLGWMTNQVYTYTLSENMWLTLLFIIGGFAMCVFMKNSMEMTQELKPKPHYSVYSAALFIYSAFHLDQVTEFLYFNF